MDQPHLLLWELSTHWLAMALYIGATVFMARGFFCNREQPLERGRALGIIGTLPHAVAMALHWYRSGHGPYLSQFESLSSTAWITLALFFLITSRLPRLKDLGLLVVPASLLLMGLASMNDPAPTYLPASFQSNWLIIHVICNKLAFATIILALGCALFLLCNRQPGARGLLGRMPKLDTLDLYSYQFCGVSFLFWTITVIAGAIGANRSWGRYWAWDPIETWSLITWLCFGLYLHLRRFHGLQGRSGAFFLLGCFVLVLALLVLLPVITGTIHGSFLLR